MHKEIDIYYATKKWKKGAAHRVQNFTCILQIYNFVCLLVLPEGPAILRKNRWSDTPHFLFLNLHMRGLSLYLNWKMGGWARNQNHSGQYFDLESDIKLKSTYLFVISCIFLYFLIPHGDRAKLESHKNRLPGAESKYE